MEQRVANLRDTQEGYRCDRSTALGNPFDMTHEEERPFVIEGCRRYLWRVIAHWDSPVEAAEAIAKEMGLRISPNWRRPTDREFHKALDEAERASVLLCWCNPLPCHCDVYVKFFAWYQARPERGV